jgi:hypothetical protein
MAQASAGRYRGWVAEFSAVAGPAAGFPAAGALSAVAVADSAPWGSGGAGGSEGEKCGCWASDRW